ncbi:MBL fold metallo-hydrolase [Peribacillus loiseleuriae]|uniref:MBL fold metallo-hydrolase n=1 Tax=Peribacillus loiseleuriae TaxID=1679170 RepID=UPI003D036A1C
MTRLDTEIKKLSIPTPYAVGDVNVYVIKGEALTLVDAGPRTHEGKEILEKSLRDLGLLISDFDQIVLTHHHPDHAGGIDFFPEQAIVFGHAYNQRWLELTEEFRAELDQFYLNIGKELGVPEEKAASMNNYRGSGGYISKRTVQSYLKEGDEIPGLFGWQVIETPGHAQSHISLFRERDGVMIGGDHLLNKISPNPILEPPFSPDESRPEPLNQYNNSLRKWLEVPISLTLPGHGGDISETHELIRHNLARQHGRAMRVKQMLEERSQTGFEICKQLFPKVYHRELGLTISETVGQLDYLEGLGEIKKEDQNGIYMYSVHS